LASGLNCHLQGSPTNCHQEIPLTRKLLVSIVAVLILLWIVGLVFKIAGAAIHVLVVVAVIVVIAGFLRKRFGSRA